MSTGSGLGPFPSSFFSVLSSGDADAEDNAMRCLSDAAVPGGQAPSPRAEEFFASGEWDRNDLLGLVLLDTDACCGVIAGSVKTAYCRVCPLPQAKCSIAAHKSSRKELVLPGWYISGGTRSNAGVFSEFYLPTEENGGPIGRVIAARLVDPDRPFRLSFGQWKFVINEFHAGRVEEVSSTSGEGQGTSPVGPDLSVEDVTPTIDTEGQADDAESEEDIGDPGRGAGPFGDDIPDGPPLTLENLLHHFGALRDFVGQLSSRQDGTQRAYGRLSDRVRSLEDAQMTDGLPRDLIERLSGFERQLRDVKNRVSAMRMLADGMVSVESLTPLEERLTRLELEFTQPHGVITQLRTSVAGFKGTLEEGGGIDCHGVRFRSKAEFAEWFESSGLDVAPFVDATAMLHAIPSAVVFASDATRTMEGLEKTKLETSLKQAVVTSFSTVLPGILVGNAKMENVAGGVYDWLSAYLKTHSVWKPTGRHTGVRDQMNAGVRSVVRRIEDYRSVRTTNPEAVALSMGLAHDSASFVAELTNFVDEWYETLTSDSAYTETAIWAMIIECLAAIFEELHAARAPIKDAAYFREGLYVWGMVKAWEIQQRFLANSIKDDPALTGILVRHIVIHGGDNPVKDEVAKIAPLEKKLADHHRSFEQSLKAIKTSVTSLDTKVKELGKKKE